METVISKRTHIGRGLSSKGEGERGSERPGSRVQLGIIGTAAVISKCILLINVCVLDVIPSCLLKVTRKWLNQDSNQRFEFCLNYARASLLTTVMYSVSVYNKIPEEAGWRGSRMLLEGWPPQWEEDQLNFLEEE